MKHVVALHSLDLTPLDLKTASSFWNVLKQRLTIYFTLAPSEYYRLWVINLRHYSAYTPMVPKDIQTLQIDLLIFQQK